MPLVSHTLRENMAGSVGTSAQFVQMLSGILQLLENTELSPEMQSSLRSLEESIDQIVRQPNNSLFPIFVCPEPRGGFSRHGVVQRE